MPKNDTDEDYKKLSQFLNRVKEIYAKLVEMKAELFPNELHDNFSNSWKIIEARIDNLINNLMNRRIDLRSPISLKDVGLAGVELDLKLSGFYEADALWTNDKNNIQKSWIQKLINLLDWIGIILSSLSFLWPLLGLPAEAVREFNDVLKGGIILKENKK